MPLSPFCPTLGARFYMEKFDALVFSPQLLLVMDSLSGSLPVVCGVSWPVVVVCVCACIRFVLLNSAQVVSKRSTSSCRQLTRIFWGPFSFVSASAAANFVVCSHLFLRAAFFRGCASVSFQLVRLVARVVRRAVLVRGLMGVFLVAHRLL